jgi:hypothetical protein
MLIADALPKKAHDRAFDGEPVFVLQEFEALSGKVPVAIHRAVRTA